MYGDDFHTADTIDEFGNVVTRTKGTHPYSYDGFIQWRGGENSEATSTAYSDRLLQQNWDLHDELCEKYFGDQGQYWGQREPDLIEKFLQDYFDKPELKLIFVMEYCNKSNGYPCWRFDFTY